MQILWSRAAQARSSCRCRRCLHAATTLARRTTTAASRRRLKIGDVFTACYSTILATAAFADAKVKEERRKEWDRLIEEAKKPSKREKKALRDQIEELDPETDDWEVQKPQDLIVETAEVPITTYKPVQDRILNATYNPFQDCRLDAWGLPHRTQVPPVGMKLYGQDWKLRGATAERIAARDVDSIYRPGLDQEGKWLDELLDADLFNREPKRPLHVIKYEDMVMNLVNNILEESKVLSNNGRSAADPNWKTLKEMSEMAERFIALNIGVSRIPTFNYDDIDTVETGRKILHQSIWAVCFAASRGQTDIDIAIVKICYNLLVSSAPPSIATYNILINEFSNLKRHDLAQIVVDSFLHESRFKPNKRTIRLLLDHYRAKADFEGFHDIIQRMRGGKGNMRIHTRNVFYLSEYPVERWALNNQVIHRSGVMIQKAPRSRPIFNSLILGSIEFGKIRAAVRYARAALREGHEVSAEALCAVIKCVVQKLDAYAGASLLRALLSQWENGSIVSIKVYSKEMRYRINQLLNLCGISSNSIWSSQGLPFRVSPAALSSLLKSTRLGTLVDALERSADFLLQLDATLGMSGLDSSYAKIKPHYAAHQYTAPQRIDWALQVVRKQSQIEKKRCAKRIRTERDSFQVRLQVIDDMVTKSSVYTLTRQAEVIDMQVTAKQLELQSLIREKTPVDRRIAEKFVLGLMARDTRPPLFDDYPMFQQRSPNHRKLDPISYLERNLFDRRKILWHRELMSGLLKARNPTRRKRLTMLRVAFIENMLDKFLDPASAGLRDQKIESEIEETLGMELKLRQKRKLPAVARLVQDEEVENVLQAYISQRPQHRRKPVFAYRRRNLSHDDQQEDLMELVDPAGDDQPRPTAERKPEQEKLPLSQLALPLPSLSKTVEAAA